MSNEIGWAIVGPGSFADRRIAPAIREAESGRLVAVCSRDKSRAEAFARGHGAEAGYDSLEETLRHPGVDALYIGSPNHLHAEQTIIAAEHGKHVLCEMLMALELSDCQRMIDACQQKNLVLGIEIQHRFNPTHIETRRRIDSGEIGDLNYIRVQYSLPWAGGFQGNQQWKIDPTPALDHSGSTGHGAGSWKDDPVLRGGGVSAGKGPEATDVLRFLAGREVEEVFAYSDVDTAPRGQETLAIVSLRFEGGLFGVLELSSRNPFADNNVVVYGSKGRLTSFGGMRLWTDGAFEAVTERGSERREFSGMNMYVDELEGFNQAVLHGTEFHPSGVDGLWERRIAQAWVQSTKTHQPVRL